ncbi:hypothetical protein CWE06_08735 [Aliidiomarina haloalkalitolerans]|uniref:Uncharacterized protein n=1 Tax=Aliidiomarina haloalkalitolerans TaxID=859059 RepID=A0A432VRY4_9GAMM|nr:hypothetical protein CWE06_08735 [Aliidiomarina haloalkalitolerans]
MICPLLLYSQLIACIEGSLEEPLCMRTAISYRKSTAVTYREKRKRKIEKAPTEVRAFGECYLNDQHD